MRWWAAPLAALMLVLSGCAPHARELDGLALVRVLGVDGGGEVTLTAVCGSTGQEDPVRGTASGGDVASARAALPWAGEEELALTNISYIVVGAQADLAGILGLILKDHEMSPSATVWLARDAGALLDACGDPAARLAVLEAQGAYAPTVVEVLADLETDGYTRLPVLVQRDGQLEPAGQAVWEGSA